MKYNINMLIYFFASPNSGVFPLGSARSIMGVTQLSRGMMYRLGGELRPWERLSFSIFGLAHGREAVLGDIGVNLNGRLQY